jgi:hypothetical protein
MTADQLDKLKEDFLTWSGGWPPESEDQITVYVDYAMNTSLNESEVRWALRELMNADS